MINLIGFWSHALAAILYAALALWRLRRWNQDPSDRRLTAALAMTSAWAIFTAFLGPYSTASGIAAAGRNFAFLAFMYSLSRKPADAERQPAIKVVYVVVAAVIGLQLTIGGVAPEFVHKPLIYDALQSAGQMIGLTIAAGSLVLVHNLYGQAAPDSRSNLRLPMIALAAMWAYDLHLDTVAYLTRAPVNDLLAMQGAVLSMLVPLFALASRRSDQWRVQLSRAATFQSISLLAILAYLLLMMSATRLLELVGGHWVRVGQIGIIFAMTVVALVLLPSGRMRALARVLLAKHLFEHRYDYREEWLRFTRTIGSAGDHAPPLGERVIKAMADIAEAPGGLLFVADDYGRLALSASWSWRGSLPEPGGDASAFVRFLETKTFVLDFGGVREGAIRLNDESVALPAWLAALDGWAGIPLLHNERLLGLVVIAHPPVRRPLDWEDFDLFRTAGVQAATCLAEARGQEALANAQRFDEFNRRFAFIIHDVKNLVSQLSLIIRNAERHADKPEFREDMIATLHSSVKKMNDLLARLGRGSSNVEAEPVRTMSVARTVAAIAEIKRRVHPVEVSGDSGLAAQADPSRLEQAMMHLVQNAIDASPAEAPIRIHYEARGREAAIDIVDAGCGMSADFVRTRLFQPFASTKEMGFGVGAYEARALVAAMGGRIEVESREGAGTRFTLLLPRGETDSARERRDAA
ncbi:MAG TPA: XrtA/PEP-CTERM system histidine kinase PrsK [Allosphingosinicella sp.]|jgi:putative PEP-CTERM system histidine kinase|nr:XrtA/PEP-CTERM system histidine kinase PrsK [Allosphingosinicella sp.]